jgi:hypothetical protein
MSTIDSTKIIRTMLKNKGVYPGDPAVFSIFEYNNAYDGRPAWKLCYQLTDEVYFLQEGNYRDVPKALFRNGEVTRHGQKFLGSQN